MSNGILLVISGPSGVGKSTIARKLRERPEFVKIVTCTTRPPRGKEVDGKDYHFLTKEQFQAKIDGGELFEWAEIHGRYYGTPKKAILDAVDAGQTVLLDIDVQGARACRKSGIPHLLIFIAPPSEEELIKRLRGRETESEAQIKRRLETAEWELKQKDEFDNIVVNRTIEQSVTDILEKLESCRKS